MGERADAVTWRHVPEAIAEHARRTPDATAVVCKGERLGYRELDRRANALSHRLRSLGVGPEVKVGVCVARSVEMIVAVLGIMKAGGAYVPLDPTYPKERLAFMLRDAGIALLVTQTAVISALPATNVPIVEIGDELADEPPAVALRDDTLAYVIYTSGSTGQPKGVMLEHGAFANLVRAMIDVFEVRAESRVLQFASLCFDASVLEIFMALPAGAALHVADGDGRTAGPGLGRWLAESAITHVALLPSILGSLPDIALPALRVIICGGEVLPPELVDRFGPGRRFLNTYGPTEGTVWATYHVCRPGEGPPSIGHPIRGAEIHLLGPDRRPVADGEPGELCIGGVGVARGYLDRPELNADRFVPHPFTISARLYRTGDLARRRADGDLEFLGRIDEQLKIRGFRVEPGEIEATLARHPAVREVAVVGREAPGGRRLVAYVVIAEGASPTASELRRFVGEALPDYMIPAAFVALPALPRLPNGKIDRPSLPAPGPERPRLGARFVAPSTATENAIARAWAEVLRVSPIGADDDFFELGGDSLSAVNVLSRVRDALGVELPVRAIFEARTVAALARRIDAEPARAEAGPALARGPETPLSALSFAQERLWFLHQAEPRSTAYNLPSIVRLRGRLDVGALGRSLAEIARRHDVLRATFELREGRPVQVIGPVPAAEIAIEADFSAFSAFDREAAFRAFAAEAFARPFDLARGPVARTQLVRLADDEHALLITTHHIVADGWSMLVWLRELAAIYGALATGRAPETAELPLRYADYAAWQRAWFDGAVAERSLAFFRGALAGAPRDVGFIGDRPRPEAHSFRGHRHAFALAPETTAALEALARAEGATLFMVLLAAFAIVVRAHADVDDLVIGTPVAGRARRELEDLIGCFANTIAIRVDAGADVDFRGLIAHVRDRALSAYAHQDAPFERVVAELAPARDARMQPLTQVMFALQDPPLSLIADDGLVLDLDQLHSDGAPFDLFAQLWQVPVSPGRAGLAGAMVHSADLFEATTARRMVDALQALLAEVAADPSKRVADLARGIMPAQRAALDAMEAALLADPAIADCAVRLRPTDDGRHEAVAYVVSASAPAASASAAVMVPIEALPIGENGRVDEEALRRIAVADGDLARRWEARVRAVDGMREAAAGAAAPRAEMRRLHLAALLPTAPAPIAQATPTAIAPQPSSRPPAMRDGGPLLVPDDAPRTLGEALARAARTDKGIRHVRADGSVWTQTYTTLLADARRVLAGLAQAGLRAGDRAILQLDAVEDHLTAFWACVLGGITPIAVAVAPRHDAPTGVTSKLHNAWELLRRPVVITTRRLVPALEGLRRVFPMEGLRALAVEDLREATAATPAHESRPEDVAFLQLTSGSTGVPKVIQETHAGVIRHIHGSAQHNGYASSDVTLNWLPFDHVVPILTYHLKDVYLACDQVQVKTEQVLASPLSWLDLMDAHRVTHSWAPNFGFKLVADAIASARGRSWDLRAVRRLMNAGEQVTLPVVRAFLEAVAPFGVRAEVMQPAFGMAEVCTCMTYQNGFDLAGGVRWIDKRSLGGALAIAAAGDAEAIPFVDLGPPMPGVSIRIADANNHVVPEGVIGRLQIKGGVLTPGYLDNPEANAEADGGEGWFDSGDLGFMLDGRLVVTGRAKETIIVRGANYYCYEVEDVAASVPGVRPTFTAAVAAADPEAGTEGLAVFFVPEDGSREARARLVAAVRARVTERLGIAPAYVVPLTEDELPKTTSGKIQRSQLKRALAEGRFASVLEAIDLALGNERTIPDWFWRRTWRAREIGPRVAWSERSRALIFLDAAGLGERVAAAIASVRVAIGPDFERIAADRYRVDPEDPEHVARLFASLAADGVEIDRIVDLCGHTGSLLALARALDRAALDHRVRLLVVSRGGQPTSPSEAVDPDLAVLPVVARTLSQEQPRVDCRHLDLPRNEDGNEVGAILAELGAARRDREVAYRGGRRLVPRLERVDLAGSPAAPALRERGTYLVSGGLGGLGVPVVRHLLDRWKARVIVIGRTPIADADERLASLREAGGDVIYEAADVADLPALRAIVDRHGARLDGVLHLAGATADRPLAEETPSTFAAVLHAKVDGARALDALLAERGGDDPVFVSFSSVNAFFGGFAAGAYSAANRFLDHLAHEQRRTGRARAYSVAWSLWDEIGMSRGYAGKSLARARGFRAIGAGEGVRSLLAVLMRDEPRVIVGLDGDNRHVSLERADAQPAERPITVWYAGDASLDDLVVRDRFGTPSKCRAIRVPALPRAEDGDVDRRALEALATPRVEARAAPTAPRSELERTLVAIWQDVLRVPSVGVHDNFFDLGGHSVLLAVVRERIRRAIGRELPVVQLFRFPTVSQLAAHLGEEAPAGRAVQDVAAEQARRMGAALERQRRRASALKRGDG